MIYSDSGSYWVALIELLLRAPFSLPKKSYYM